MKGTKFIGAIAAAMLVIAQSLGAQPQGPWGGGFGGRMANMPTPQERAENQAKQLQKELLLDNKQYKKVYNLTYKEANLRQSLMQDKIFGAMGMQGGFPGGMGMGFPGGGMGEGMGMPGGMGGGRGGFRMPSDTTEMRKGFENMMKQMNIENEPAMVKFQQKKEAKMRKILSANQFERWNEIKNRQPQDMMREMMQRRGNGGPGAPGRGPGNGPENRPGNRPQR